MDNNSTLTNDQLNEVIGTITENTSQQVHNLRELHEKVENEDNSNYPLEHELVSLSSNSTNEYITISEDGFNIKTDPKIFDVDDKKIEEEIEKEFKENTIKIAKETYGLEEKLIIDLIPIINEYRKNDEYPVWKNMSENLRAYIRRMSFETNENIDPKYYPLLAKEFVKTIVEEIETDVNCVDIQNSLDELLNIPNIVDLYSEHVSEVMNTSILETIEDIKDTDPEKAEQLRKIRTKFFQAYNFDLLYEAYNSSSRIRKKVRKDYYNWKNYCNDVNHYNKKTKFIISDAVQMHNSLYHIFADTGNALENSFCNSIDKFIVLLCMSLEDKDRENIIDASYVYYLIKNIIVLGFTEEGKTNYSKQLINNIKAVIDFINTKEGEFYDQQGSEMSKRKPSKSVRKRMEKQSKRT